MSPAQALAMIIKMNLTAQNYQQLRLKAIDQGADIYPSYKRVKKHKKLCVPQGIKYKADEVVVSIDKVLDHQLKKILDLNPEIVDEIHNLKRQYPGIEFKFYFKYGAGTINTKSIFYFQYDTSKKQNGGYFCLRL